MTIGSNDQIFSAAAYRPIIVAYRNGAPVRLSRRGQRRSTASRTTSSPRGLPTHRNGYKPVVLLDIQRQPGANIIQTVDRIKALLPAVDRDDPARR